MSNRDKWQRLDEFYGAAAEAYDTGLKTRMAPALDPWTRVAPTPIFWSEEPETQRPPTADG